MPITDPTDVLSNCTVTSYDDAIRYTFFYYDSVTNRELIEMPELELCQPNYQDLVTCVANTVEVPNNVFGTIYIRVLDAFHPRFEKLNFTTFKETHTVWRVEPDTYEVFYPRNPPDSPGVRVTVKTAGETVQVARCKAAGDQVALDSYNGSWYPTEKFDVIDVDMICWVSRSSEKIYYLFPVQFMRKHTEEECIEDIDLSLMSHSATVPPAKDNLNRWGVCLRALLLYDCKK
ncbi:unnamed protein product [Echinostoma caproni]|uniref:Uncharacterized protein n=1 Tax=Echinostoma caproni TaxID=27848 RepID=A0A3P8GZY2_9TREM|nr:unnamed protein product [Echinostoma caproni]